MKKLAKVANKTWTVAALVAGVSLTFIMLLIVANIIMRRFLGKPIFGSTEIVRYASLIGGALALAMNEWFDGNIQMTFLLENISAKKRLVIELVDYIVCSVAFIYISYLLCTQTVTKYVKLDSTTDLHMPIYIFAGILAFGFILLTICLICKSILKAHEIKTGERLYGPHANYD